LLQCDPVRELADAGLWERALSAASTVVAHASFLTAAIAEHADIVFPAEAYAEKEGTVVHPDGRLQRLRPAIARAGAVRAGWQVLGELGERVGVEVDVLSGTMASERVFEAVPFYGGLSLEEIGGRGVRWQDREAASAFPAVQLPAEQPPAEALAAADPGQAAYRSVWDAVEVEHSPALAFLHPARELV
jgi:NADH-quinone oxidoreductase subunit G